MMILTETGNLLDTTGLLILIDKTAGDEVGVFASPTDNPKVRHTIATCLTRGEAKALIAELLHRSRRQDDGMDVPPLDDTLNRAARWKKARHLEMIAAQQAAEKEAAAKAKLDAAERQRLYAEQQFQAAHQAVLADPRYPPLAGVR